MKERRKKLVLAAVSGMMTLAFAEAALRLLGIGAAGRGSPWFAGGNHPRFLFQPDPASGYTLRPGFRGREISPGGEFEVTAAVDRRGLRDHPHTAGPRPCVLALGDSMTFGEGVEGGAAYPAVLERTAGIRVYNGGVPGYGSPQMLARLDRLLPELRPDGVTVAISPFWDAHRAVGPFVYKDGYIVSPHYRDRLYLIGGNLYHAETRLPVLGPATAYAKGRSNLLRTVLPALTERARALVRSEDSAALPDPRPSAEALEALWRRASAAGAGFLVILVDSDSRGDDHRRARPALEAELRKRGVPYLALDTFLKGADWPRLRYPRDGHWNAAGHKAVGTALAPVVRELAGPHPRPLG